MKSIGGIPLVKIVALLLLAGACGLSFLALLDEIKQGNQLGICLSLFFLVAFGHSAVKLFRSK